MLCRRFLSVRPGPPPPMRFFTTATAAIKGDKKPALTSLVPPSFVQRMILTGEIAVSKLFPGGFGWQAGSVIAGNMGYKATEIPLWLFTGVGDLLGVFLGHMVYMAIKKSILPSKKTLGDEFGVGIWLGTAAFCSGTFWQPTVNLFAGLGFAFPMVALFTTIVCSGAFLTGLRAGRRIYNPLGIEKAHSRNFAEDAGLSVAIGGASGMFVGTDITIPKNCLDSFVGVYPDMTPVEGCIKAGTSTAVGFTLFHSIQNTRAQASSAYVTSDTFKDIATSLVIELEQTSGITHSEALKKFVSTDVNILFAKLDKDGDGKITTEELKEELKKVASSH